LTLKTSRPTTGHLADLATTAQVLPPLQDLLLKLTIVVHPLDAEPSVIPFGTVCHPGAAEGNEKWGSKKGAYASAGARAYNGV